jgi:ABC-2 type transport system permease protein
MIAAILRAQFLSMRFGGMTLSWVARIIWYGIWTVVAAAAFLLAASMDGARLHALLPWGMLAICAYWQMMPILSASMGAGLDLRKLLVYPVPHRQLFLVEVLLRFTSGAEMLLVLTGVLAGVAVNDETGGWTKIPRVLIVGLIFVLFNVLLASGTRSILERLLARRKVREVMAILMAMIWVLPRFLIATGFRPKSVGPAAVFIGLLALPWSAAARAAFPLRPGHVEWLALLGLCGWTLLAFWFGRRQFERSLRYDAIAAQATAFRPGENGRSWTEWFYRLPALLWHDPLAAIAEKELRSLSRTPRFRMVFVMGFTFGLLVWFPMIVTRRPGVHAEPSPYFLLIVCLYALTLLGQVSYWNCFGFDRSATAFYFAAPVPISKVLIGKNLASLFFIYLEVLILTSVTLALRLSTGWQRAVESLIVMGICSLYTLALGNISSVRYPRGLNPERVSQGGGSGKFQGLVFLFYPVTLLPVGLAYLARYAFNSDWIFAIGLTVAAIIGGVLYSMSMESAAYRALEQRETIVAELSKGDGPVMAE